MTRPRCRLSAPGLLLAALLCGGCVAPRQAQPVAAPPVDTPAIAYVDLATAFNARVGQLGRLWSRTRVEVRWIDTEGKRRFDAGEGYLIYELPSRVALSVGKVGQTGLWAGSNEEFYWLLDAQSDPRRAWFGRHDRVGVRPPADFPLAVAPHDLPRLLGIAPLPLEPDDAVTISHDAGACTLLLPQQHMQLTLDAVTLMPLRVALLDDEGRVVIASQLGSPQPVRIRGLGSADWPLISGRIRVSVNGDGTDLAPEADMTLELVGDVLGGDARGRINPRLFDFDHLADQQFRIAPAHRIDLDEAAGDHTRPVEAPPDQASFD